MKVSTVITRILERLEGYYEEFFIEDEHQGVTVVYKDKEYRIFVKDLAIYEFLMQVDNKKGV